jgi:hypothetical protein
MISPLMCSARSMVVHFLFDLEDGIECTEAHRLYSTGELLGLMDSCFELTKKVA